MVMLFVLAGHQRPPLPRRRHGLLGGNFLLRSTSCLNPIASKHTARRHIAPNGKISRGVGGRPRAQRKKPWSCCPIVPPRAAQDRDQHFARTSSSRIASVRFNHSPAVHYLIMCGCFGVGKTRCLDEAMLYPSATRRAACTLSSKRVC